MPFCFMARKCFAPDCPYYKNNFCKEERDDNIANGICTIYNEFRISRERLDELGGSALLDGSWIKEIRGDFLSSPQVTYSRE